MFSCASVRFPSVGPSAAALIGVVRQIPLSETADRVQAFMLKREVKDFFKFWGRLSVFMKLANLRAYWPDLLGIAVYTKRFDYIDVFARKLPRFKAAAYEAWTKGTITRRLLNHTIDFGGGVIKVTARWLPKGSLLGRLGLPVTAATALVFAREQLVFEVPALLQKELSFTKEVAQNYHDRLGSEDKTALFKEIKGAYNTRAAELLVSQLQSSEITDQLVSHVKDHLKKERYHKLSDGIHSLVSSGFLTYAVLAGMGAFASGALLTLMLTPYIARHVIDYTTPLTSFSVSKQT